VKQMQKGLCCGVCTELLYQPFNLNCGHVFCYSVCVRGVWTDFSVLWIGSRKLNGVRHVESASLASRLCLISYTHPCRD
jgi:hypothetical protein